MIQQAVLKKPVNVAENYGPTEVVVYETRIGITQD